MSNELEFTKVESADRLPAWVTRSQLVEFFHATMEPYQDKPEDIDRALDYAFNPQRGGFLMLARRDGGLAGALLMLKTGMSGYVPENILVFVTVAPHLRNQGVGRRLIDHSVAQCSGSVKLHVEYDNPAKRLYERVGFSTKYAEMRFPR
ncbi:GNAT family N-acetyltransferase [candidate division WOR-3 bacterium]|nr:GNAT family N-acetyltransferase [candidate division WOR-3 bacterium]